MQERSRMSKKAVVVLSGGMDSSTLLHYVVKELAFREIYTISFKYAQRHIRELLCAQDQVKALTDEVDVRIEHTTVDTSFFGELTKDVSALTGKINVPHIKEVLGDPQPVTYVPFRNMMFLTIALAHAENNKCPAVFYGAQKHDTYSGYFDASEEFRVRLNRVAELNRKHQITVEAPFVNMSKSDLLEWGLGNNVDYSKTWTCYNGGDISCGTCPTCADRIQAFKTIDKIDPLSYIADPWKRKTLLDAAKGD